MSRLADEIRKIREANKDIAGLACHIADLRLDAFTPDRAHEHQNWVRQQRLWAEHRLRILHQRIDLRKKRLKRFTGPSRGIVNQALIERERQLEMQVRILQQIGDTIAWRMLRADVRLLAALSDRLPSEEAMPVALALSYPEFQKSWEEYLNGAVGAR